MGISPNLTIEEEKSLIKTLCKYRDVFTWRYTNLKGVDPTICKHTIPTKEDSKPRKQKPYIYNDTFAQKIWEDIENLLEAEFVYKIEHM